MLTRVRNSPAYRLDCCGSDTVFLDPGQFVASVRASSATRPVITLLIEIKARLRLSLDCLASMRPRIAVPRGKTVWL